MKHDKKLLFFTYNLLYVNDLAYNAILSIKNSLSNDEHKETIKIYNALLKKCDKYNQMTIDITKNYRMALSEFFSFIDEKVDPLVEELETQLGNSIKKQLPNQPGELLTKIELAKILCDIAKFLYDNVYQDRKKFELDISKLMYLRIGDISKNCDGLSEWYIFLHRHNIDLDLNKEPNICSAFKSLVDQVMNTNMYSDGIRVLNKSKIKQKQKNKRVMVYLNNDEEHKQFYNSINECAKFFKVSPYYIRKCHLTKTKLKNLFTIQILY
ncbi:MAG: hypothetical protein ACI35S_06720 [Anaeroplasma sp.]